MLRRYLLPTLLGSAVLLSLTGCASLPNPVAITSTPTASTSTAVDGIPQKLDPPSNTTAITSLIIPDEANCEGKTNGDIVWIDVAWEASGNVEGVTWTRDGSELGDGYDASGALQLPYACNGYAHHYGIVVQGVNWPSDYQIADKIVHPGGKK